MIQFMNTLSGKVELFKPFKERKVGLYTCGPTVYDYAHIGNFRTFVFEDLLRRFLEAKGFRVKHVMNITDVDDKTIQGAQREGKTLDEFTTRFIDAFCEDLKVLNVLAPNHPKAQPRATREIPEMIKLIQTLIKKEAAYATDGSVYYRIDCFADYGKLSKKKLERNVKGTRVDSDEYEKKEEASDFALWKKAKEGEPSWDSPWGKGRPGWHVECSQMSMRYLGAQFDIHAGGEDLIFPHHENEIAQSEGATEKKPFVRMWLHAKHLLVDGEKMSKSKGNFYTLRDLIKKGFDPVAIRYALLSVHYRSQLNFTLDGLKEASDVVKKLDDAYFQCLSRADAVAKPKLRGTSNLGGIYASILKALEDDLNISEAIAHFLSGVKEVNRLVSEKNTTAQDLQDGLGFFEQCDALFGFDIASEKKIQKDVVKKLSDRNHVRSEVNFTKDRNLQQKSDALRSEIEQLGWLVKDARPGESSAVKKRRRVWD